MTDPRRHAAALLAVLIFLAAPAAQAAEPVLLAQLDDATLAQSDEEAQPPLSEEPPEGLGEGEEEPEPEPEEEAEGDGGNGGGGKSSRGEREPLPETGIESALIALLGVGLILSGSGLRLTLGRGNAV